MIFFTLARARFQCVRFNPRFNLAFPLYYYKLNKITSLMLALL